MKIWVVGLLLVAGGATPPTICDHWRYEEPARQRSGKDIKSRVICFVDEQFEEHILLYHSDCIQRQESGFLVLICPSTVHVPGALLMSTARNPQEYL